jgi:hypothetical protein
MNRTRFVACSLQYPHKEVKGVIFLSSGGYFVDLMVDEIVTRYPVSFDKEEEKFSSCFGMEIFFGPLSRMVLRKELFLLKKPV